LDGKTPAGTLDLMTVARLLLVALGEDDIDAILAKLFDEEGNPLHPAPAATAPATDVPAAEAMMVDAVKELHGALIRLREGHTDGRAS
jgi:hypothetical protein